MFGSSLLIESTDCMVSVGAHQGLVQPCIRYPSMLTGTKRRAFSYDWFKKYRWLEYSKVKDVAYCYACRIFSVSAIGKKLYAFMHTGFRDWKQDKMEVYLNMIVHTLTNKQCYLRTVFFCFKKD